MRFVSLLNPWTVAKGIRYLGVCLRRRPLLHHFLARETFLERCLAHQPILELFLNSRGQLEGLDMDEGTMFFEEEKRLLQEAVQKSNGFPGPIIEIGTLFGGTTTRMAVWKKPEKKILTVDNYSWNPWKLPRATHRGLTRRFLAYLIETGQVEALAMEKDLFYARYRGKPPSLVFLDAIHTYEETKKDIEWAKSMGTKLIAGHDYSPGFPGVGQAVEEAGGVCAHSGSVWVLKNPYWETVGPDIPLAKCA